MHQVIQQQSDSSATEKHVISEFVLVITFHRTSHVLTAEICWFLCTGNSQH